MTATTWTENAIERLTGAGYRTGAARRQVLELLAGQACAVTALEIDERLPSVGRASVYRTLEQLEELRLVQRVELGGSAGAYERIDPSGHHHHLVCDRCERLSPFDDPVLERAIEEVASSAGFDLVGHDVLLRGLCPRCQRAQA
jgi:Fur family ferric uptake transcriptional regulator